MAKRGPLSFDEKKAILDVVEQDADITIAELAEELDRTENSVQNYIHEITELGLSRGNDNEDVKVDGASEVEEEEPDQLQNLKRKHLEQIIPSNKGATTMTPMGSEYLDERHKKRTRKQKYGKWAKNVIKIREEE